MAEDKVAKGSAAAPQRGVDASRRRMLRASAAAPLIASLTPNPVAAMASATCADKPASQLNATRGDVAGDATMGVRAEVFQDYRGQQFYRVRDKFYDQDGLPVRSTPPGIERVREMQGRARFAARGDQLESMSFDAQATTDNGLTPSCDASINPTTG